LFSLVIDFLEKQFRLLFFCNQKMSKRVVYQIDPKRRNPDGSFPDFVFKNAEQRWFHTKWLYNIWRFKKHNAENKGVAFGLRFRSFLNFCRKTNYPALRGTASLDMTIDRKNNRKHYIMHNIQMLTSRDNVRKYWRKDKKLGEEGKEYRLLTDDKAK
jgi:hypothetical protein